MYLRKEETSLERSVSCRSIGKEHKKRGGLRLVKLYSKTHRGHTEIRERSRIAQESAMKDDLVRRKRKTRVKPLQYTDDEDEFDSANSKENISEKTRADNLCSPVEELPNSQNNSGSEIGTSHDGVPAENSEENPESDGSKKSSGTERNGLIVENILECLSYKTAYSEKQVKSEIQLSGTHLQRDLQDLTGKMDCVVNDSINDYNVRRVESEVEMVGEYGENGNCERKVNCGKEGRKFRIENEESDSRDESEDDRATVAFEKSLNDSATDFEEVFEMAEEKIRRVEKKFQKKKIMNRKKRTLVKFKRKKSMIGRNLAKVKKLKNKYSPVGGSGLQPAEKESNSERNMKEVCGMVKRLHELYRIILRLQKDLPMDAEQTDYFISVINAEQENFYKELKKSQKTIMRGYDRMLSSFGNSSTVSKEIGKRTSLSKEDIANVISRCTSNLGGGEEKKRAVATEEKEPTTFRELSPKTFGVADCSRELREHNNDKIDALFSAEAIQEVGPPQPVRVEKPREEDLGNTSNLPEKSPAPGSRNAEDTADPVSIPCFQPLHPSGNRRPPKPVQRPGNEPKIAKEVATRENHPTTYFPHVPSGPFFRASQTFRNNFQGQWPDHSKPRPHFCPQKNCTHRTHGVFRDPRFRQYPHHDPRDVHGNQARPLSLRPVHNQSSNFRPQYTGDGLPVHCGSTTAVNYSPSNSTVGFFQVPGGFVAPAAPVAGTSPRLHIPSLTDISPYPLGYSQRRSPAHFPQVPDPCSLAPGVRPVPLYPHFDRSRHGNTPLQTNRTQKNSNCSTKSPNNFRRRNIVSPSKGSECSASGAPSPPSRGEQCPLGILLANFDRLLRPKTPAQTLHTVTDSLVKPEQMCSLSTEPTSKSVPCESYNLDPTVPQKLTMRNCRLEAGPILKLKSESWKPEGGEGSSQWQEPSANAIGEEALNQKELNSRVYVCAQNGCKNPGVRICKGCLSIIYCSETCQLKHWTLKHKTECHQLKELRG